MSFVFRSFVHYIYYKYLMKIYIFCIVAVFILGCVGPKKIFQPKPISPNQTISSFESRTLDNPSLRGFIEKNLHHEITSWPPKSWDFTMLTLAAFYYHPDLDIARAKRGFAEGGIVKGGEIPNPTLGLRPQYNTTGGGSSPWTLGLNLDIPVETAGKRGYRIAQARHLSDAASFNIYSVAWQVRSRLRANLLNLYSALLTEELLKKQQVVREEIVGLMERRLKAGESSKPEVNEVRLSLDRTNLTLHDLQRQKSETIVQIADSIGISSQAINGVDFSFDTINRFLLNEDFSIADTRRHALLNRPDILGSLSEYAATESSLQLEIAKQHPDIHLGPGYSWDQGDNKWSIGFSIELPVFNRNEGQIAEAEARRKEAEARFISLQVKITGEIDRIIKGYSTSLQKLKTAELILSEQKEQYQAIDAKFKIGEVDRLKILTAKLDLLSAETSRLDALIKAQATLGALEDAVQFPLNELPLSAVIPENKEGGNK